MNFGSQVAAYLPSSEGYLPFFVFLIGVTAITNSISCYHTDSYVRRLYAGPSPPTSIGSRKTTLTTTEVVEDASLSTERKPSTTSLATAASDDSPVNALSTRTFGTWNIAVGIVRLYAAYNIHEASWYQMQMITCMVGIFHFGTEAFVFKTARPSGPWFAPVATALVCLLWSIAQYNFYVR